VTRGGRPVVALVALVAALVAAGCTGAGQSPAASSPASAVPSAVPTAVAPSPVAPSSSAAASAGPASSDSGSLVPESPVAGIVTAVDSSGLAQVKGFTLRTNDGEIIVFKIGVLQNGDEFPPGHLKEHQATAAPILVFFNQVGNELVVYRIEDAG